MKRLITLWVCVTACMLNADAQSASVIGNFRNDPSMAAGNYRYYGFTPTAMTPAPAGYKPFYISQYSRHGSRYHTSESHFRPCMPVMATCDSLGILSEAGEEWYENAKTIYAEHQGMFGMLTTRGSQELAETGKRTYERFPEVFSGRKGRNLIRSRSTRTQRSIVSMAAFNTAIARKAPDMAFSYAAGDRYRAYLNADADNYGLIRSFSCAVEDSLKHAVNTDEVFGILFSDTEKAKEIIDDPYAFVKSVFNVSSISPNTDARPDMAGYFSPEALAGYWMIRNNCLYAECANSEEMADETAGIAAPLAEDFVRKADEALQDGSSIAADFRFGHDTGLLPFIAATGIEGMHIRHSAYEAHKYWNSSEFMPMGSNIQFIFYRNRKGQILVKILYNEKETLIPALTPVASPYYSWPQVRALLLSLTH